MESATFRHLLETAWQRRAALRSRTGAYRLLNGAASGTPGLVVDMFSEYAVAYAYDTELASRYGNFAALLAEVTGAKAVSFKDRTAKDESGREEGADLHGHSPETAEVRENSLAFIVHLRHPRNVGLFLDTRPLREALAKEANASPQAGRDVLNLFSYACSLGVAAAKGNPGRVVNVDVSARYLGWGRDNYKANGIAEEKGAFVRMDCEEYLDWAARKEMKFDSVILDPPSFSRAGRGSGGREDGTYSFTRDYPRLLEKCARVSRPGGVIFALTNYAKISPPRFRALVEDALRGAGQQGSGLNRLAALKSMPFAEDFDPPPANTPWKPSSEGSLIALEATLR